MSRLTELASKATPRPWSAPPYIVPWSKDAPDMAYVAGVVMPRVNADLIVALVNKLDAIQELFDAAEEIDLLMADIPPQMRRGPWTNIGIAVEALRDLLGGDHADSR